MTALFAMYEKSRKPEERTQSDYRADQQTRLRLENARRERFLDVERQARERLEAQHGPTWDRMSDDEKEEHAQSVLSQLMFELFRRNPDSPSVREEILESIANPVRRRDNDWSQEC